MTWALQSLRGFLQGIVLVECQLIGSTRFVALTQRLQGIPLELGLARLKRRRQLDGQLLERLVIVLIVDQHGRQAHMRQITQAFISASRGHPGELSLCRLALIGLQLHTRRQHGAHGGIVAAAKFFHQLTRQIAGTFGILTRCRLLQRRIQGTGLLGLTGLPPVPALPASHAKCQHQHATGDQVAVLLPPDLEFIELLLLGVIIDRHRRHHPIQKSFRPPWPPTAPAPP